MTRPALGRPRDEHLHQVILEAAREMLGASSYAEVSMEAIASRAGVGKKTLYRRWASKAPLVADAVLDAYGRSGSFEVPDTGDLAADLRAWLREHDDFINEGPNAALIRALIAAAAANPDDNAELYQQLSKPQHSGLTKRLVRAVEQRQLRGNADVDAMANAMIGSLLLRVLNRDAQGTRVDGLVDALLTENAAP